MFEKLNQNDTYTLGIEKVKTDWWIELIDRATGNVRIITAKRKDKALAIFKGMTIPEIEQVYTHMAVAPHPMYKAGVM